MSLHTRTLLGIALTLLIAPAHALVVLESESNDSFATAQNLGGNFSSESVANIFNSTTLPHASVSGNIGGQNGANDVDYYRFTVTGVGVVGFFDIDDASFAVGGGGVEDSYLSLFDSDFNLLATSDDSSPNDPGTVSRFDPFLGSYLFSSSGVYFIVVSEVANQPMILGTSVGNMIRPDGSLEGGNLYAGDSGSTSVANTEGSYVGNYTLHVSLSPADSSPVPEPTTLALLGIGLVGISQLRRRAKASPCQSE